MSKKKLLDDAEEAYSAWREAKTGSYLERTIEQSIVADITPALIFLLKGGEGDGTGFQKEEK